MRVQRHHPIRVRDGGLLLGPYPAKHLPQVFPHRYAPTPTIELLLGPYPKCFHKGMYLPYPTKHRGTLPGKTPTPSASIKLCTYPQSCYWYPTRQNTYQKCFHKGMHTPLIGLLGPYPAKHLHQVFPQRYWIFFYKEHWCTSIQNCHWTWCLQKATLTVSPCQIRNDT